MDNTPVDQPAGAPTPFSALLNYLFATRPNPATGQPWTPAQVSRATGGKLSETYLSYLRSGKIASPPLDRVQLLAEVFGVNVGFFTGKYNDAGTAVEPGDAELWDALSKPLVREVAKRAGNASAGERALILQMLERAEQMAKAAEALDAAGSNTAMQDTSNVTENEVVEEDS